MYIACVDLKMWNTLLNDISDLNLVMNLNFCENISATFQLNICLINFHF